MIIRPIEKSDSKSGFCCGRPALDVFFSKRAWDNNQAGVARVFVMQDDAGLAGDRGAIVGYYTLSAKEAGRERLQKPLPRSLPKYPLPVFYIGYFAIAEQYQGRGFGRQLLANALRRCLEAAQDMGAVGVLLDSLDDQSTAFYRSLGFEEIPHAPGTPIDGPQPMFLTMAAIARAKPASS